MTVGLVRPPEGEVLHFSEDPSITTFSPHVAKTAQQARPYVWAVDHRRAQDYWFPRACPRALTWVAPVTTPTHRELFLGTSWRVHAIEYGWLSAMQATVLYAYRFAASDFTPFGTPEPHAHVATMTVRPLGPPEKVGSLLAAHEAAGIELRVLTNLWPYWNRVVASTVGYSGIRLGNARPPGERAEYSLETAVGEEVGEIERSAGSAWRHSSLYRLEKPGPGSGASRCSGQGS